MKLANKIIIVTGAGGGIGSELVLELLDRGARVVACDLKDEYLQKLKDRANVTEDVLSFHTVDITDRSSVESTISQIVKQHGRIDGLINCAGIIQPFVKVNDLKYESIEKVMNVNFYGTLYMVKVCLPQLLKRPEAHIVNVSSMGGFLPVPGQSVYGASKAAVKLLTEGLYAELLDTNVKVSVAFPGATETEISKNSGVEISSSTESEGSKNYKMLPADEAAKIIIDGMESNKPQIFTGKDSNLMNKLYRLSPVRATRLIAKQMKSLLGN